MEFTRRYLDLQQGSLVPEAPQEQQSRTYDADSKQTIGVDLTFDGRTELTGPMVLKLWISALDADDLDLFVALKKFDRQGREVHFCGKDGFREGIVALGWLRVSQRHLNPERSEPWALFEP